MASANQDPSSLEAKKAEAKAIGLPLTPADLKIESVPDSQNGAILVDQVVQKAHTDSALKGRLALIEKTRQKTATDADRQLALVVLDNLKDEMDLMLAATEKPKCIFPIDWSNLLTRDGGYLRVTQEIVRAFCLKAEQLSSAGDSTGALTQLEDGHKVSKLFEGNPGRVNSSSQIVCDLDIEKSLHRILAAHRYDATFLAAAKKMHDGFGPIPDYRFAFRTEMVYVLANIEQMTTPRAEMNQADLTEEEWNTRVTFSEKGVMKEHTLTAYTAFFSVLPKNPERWKVVLEVARDAFRQLFPESDEISRGAFRLFNTKDLFGWDYLIAAYARDRTLRRLNDTSILVLQSIAQTGKAPPTLPDFGETSTDPMTGFNFKYESSGRSFKLISEGPGPLDYDTKFGHDEFSFD